MRSRNQASPDIADFYNIKVKSIWRGFRQEHYSFWAICVYFMFEYVRPQSIYPSIDIIPWAQIALLVSVVAVFLDKSTKWVDSPENKYLFLFVLVVVLSGIFAFRPSASWADKDLLINWVLVYFLVINIVNTEKRLFIFVLLYLLFSFKMAQHGFFSWASRGFEFASWGLAGPSGWFNNSGEYAIQMLIFSFLSMSFVIALRSQWSRLKKLFFYFMPVTGVFAVIGSSSRGAQLALAVIGVVLLFKRKGGFKSLLILVAAAVALFYLLPDEQLLRFQEMGSDKTSLQRLSYWKFGLQVMNDNPLLGIGYGNWLDYFLFEKPEGLRGGISLPHNIFIQAGSELGYAGLLCFVIMVSYVFILNARTRTMVRETDNRFLFYLSYGMDAGLLGYIVAGFFVTVLYYPFFWVQMAMTVALYNIAKDFNHAREHSIRPEADNIVKARAATQ